MVAFLAAAGVLAKAAVKAGFKGIRKAGDYFTAVRKRYTRQAQRYEKMATQASGIEKSRYEALARTSLEKAIATYEDPTTGKYSKQINDLAGRLSPRIPVKKNLQYRAKVAAESEYALSDAFSGEDERREYEAIEVLNSKIGDRVYAALVDVWQGLDYYARNDAIMEYFGVDSMADVLDIIERAGIDIYQDPGSLEKYDEVRNAIERYLG